jgi:hypothetical protein
MLTAPGNEADKELFITLSQADVIRPVLSDFLAIEITGAFVSNDNRSIGHAIATLLMRSQHGIKPLVLKPLIDLVRDDTEAKFGTGDKLEIYDPKGEEKYWGFISPLILTHLGNRKALDSVARRYAKYDKDRQQFMDNSIVLLENFFALFPQPKKKQIIKELSIAPEDFIAQYEKLGAVQEVALSQAEEWGIKCKIDKTLPLHNMGLLGIFVRALLYLKHLQIKTKKKPDIGDFADIHHSVLAGLPGNLVTGEKEHKLPSMFGFAWKGSGKVLCYSYECFIQYLKDLETYKSL